MEEEATIIRQDTAFAMLKVMTNPESSPRGPELQFRNSGLVKPGWLLVTGEDETSRLWLLQQ